MPNPGNYTDFHTDLVQTMIFNANIFLIFAIFFKISHSVDLPGTFKYPLGDFKLQIFQNEISDFAKRNFKFWIILKFQILHEILQKRSLDLKDSLIWNKKKVLKQYFRRIISSIKKFQSRRLRKADWVLWRTKVYQWSYL